MLTTYQKQAQRKLAATVVTIMVVAGMMVLADHLKSADGSASPVTPVVTAPTSSAASNSPASSTSYKDGTYTASADYYVPHGDENIQVTLTLSNGSVTNASIQNSEGDPTSASYQHEFASMFKSYVVGQKISSLQLGVIAGASDTTQAFNQAVSQIATKAQA